MIAFRLARDVGEWDVDGMLKRMPARLFSQWCEFYVREPMAEGFYLGFALLGKLIADLLGAKNARLDTFMPPFGDAGNGRQREEMSSDNMEAVFRRFAKAHNKALANG